MIVLLMSLGADPEVWIPTLQSAKPHIDRWVISDPLHRHSLRLLAARELRGIPGMFPTDHQDFLAAYRDPETLYLAVSPGERLVVHSPLRALDPNVYSWECWTPDGWQIRLYRTIPTGVSRRTEELEIR